MPPTVQAMNLTKRYNSFVAVNDLTLQVEEGEVFGFLGPNGAGKTTTILMLLGLTVPSSGEARVLGFDPSREPLKVKRQAGYLPENLGLYGDLRGEDNLLYIARLNGLDSKEAARKVTEVLELVGMTRAARQRVETYSRGMKQRLSLAGVLLKSPKVVFLDEPTSGLDPEGARDILDLITRMSRDQKMTVFISSHLLYQVQQICHRVGIISQGRLVAQGTLDDLGKQAMGGGRTIVEVDLVEVPAALPAALKRIGGVTSVQPAGASVVIECSDDCRARIAKQVAESGGQLVGMRARGYGLDEIYHKYFGEA